MKHSILLVAAVAYTAVLAGCAQSETTNSRKSSYTGGESTGSHLPHRYDVDAPYPGPKAVGAGEQPFVSSAAGGQNRGGTR